MSEQDFSFYSELLGDLLQGFRWLSLPLGVLVFTDIRRLKQGALRWIPSMMMGMITGLGCFCNAYLMGFGIQSILSERITASFDFRGKDDLSIFLRRQFVLWLFICISFVVLTLIFLFVLHRIVRIRFAQTIYEAMYLSVPGIMAYLLSKFFAVISVIPMEKEVFVLSEQIRVSNGVFLVMAVLLFVCEAFLAASWQKNRVMGEKEEQMLFLNLQTQALKKRLTDAEAEQKKLSGFRHDLKNHLTNLHGLLQGGAYPEAERYLCAMEEDMNPVEQRFYTGNALLDVMLNDKYIEAEKAGVTFSANVDGEHIPEQCLYDLGVLLTNLIDNGIHAASEKRTELPAVFVSLKRRGNFLVFRIRNTCLEAIDIDPQTHLPVIHAKKGPGHGIGVRNAVDICEKYLGTMEYSQKDTEVTVTGMLQMKELFVS